ncbi:MAG: cobalt ECF transporter T component CbiQ [Akkermansia sp.]
MNAPEKALQDMDKLDTLSHEQSFIHKLDPRAKILTTLSYIITLLSLSPDNLSGMSIFLLYPVLVIRLANLPLGYLFKRSLIALPFVLFIGIFNPLLDHTPAITWGDWTISRGWISFASIVIRAILSVLSALILVATTGFPAICSGLKKLGVPSVMTTQLVFVFRYIFLLITETGKMTRAATLRNPSQHKITLRTWGSLLGNILFRAIARAERIHTAMLSRGFSGTIPTIRGKEFGWRESIYLLSWTLIFCMMRFTNPVQIMGNSLQTLLS